MKFPVGRWGLTADPRGAHVTLPWRGQTLLGEVRAVRRDPVTGCFRLTVVHFNGEPWPVEPTVSAVDVLERED